MERVLLAGDMAALLHPRLLRGHGRIVEGSGLGKVLQLLVLRQETMILLEAVLFELSPSLCQLVPVLFSRVVARLQLGHVSFESSVDLPLKCKYVVELVLLLMVLGFVREEERVRDGQIRPSARGGKG